MSSVSASLAGLAIVLSYIAPQAGAQAPTEEATHAAAIEALAMLPGATYWVAATGLLYVMGDTTLWGERVTGVKGCPVLYSLCSDSPLPVTVGARLKVPRSAR